MTDSETSKDNENYSFFRALLVEDHLGFVVRAHIHIEHTLRRIIEIALPNSEHMGVDQLSYSTSVRLAISLGLNPRFKPPLQALGRLRNRFAHELEAQINQEDARKLYSSFALIDRDTIQTLYAGMKADRLVDDVIWDNRDAKDQITFCVVVLRGALLAAHDALLEGPPELRALLNGLVEHFPKTPA